MTRKRVIPWWCCVTVPTNGHALTGNELKMSGGAAAVAAVPAWSALAKHMVYHVLCPSFRYFDSEILTGIIGLPRVDPGQHENNAVGGIFIGASKRGMIEKVGTTKSLRPISHANDHNMWVGTGKVWLPQKGKKAVPCLHCGGWV